MLSCAAVISQYLTSNCGLVLDENVEEAWNVIEVTLFSFDDAPIEPKDVSFAVDKSILVNSSQALKD